MHSSYLDIVTLIEKVIDNVLIVICRKPSAANGGVGYPRKFSSLLVANPQEQDYLNLKYLDCLIDYNEAEY